MSCAFWRPDPRHGAEPREPLRRPDIARRDGLPRRLRSRRFAPAVRVGLPSNRSPSEDFNGPWANPRTCARGCRRGSRSYPQFRCTNSTPSCAQTLAVNIPSVSGVASPASAQRSRILYGPTACRDGLPIVSSARRNSPRRSGPPPDWCPRPWRRYPICTMSERPPVRADRGLPKRGRGNFVQAGWAVPVDALPGPPIVIGTVDSTCAAPRSLGCAHANLQPRCAFSVDELIWRTTPHCRSRRPVGDSAKGPIGQETGWVVKAGPLDRRRFGRRR